MVVGEVVGVTVEEVVIGQEDEAVDRLGRVLGVEGDGDGPHVGRVIGGAVGVVVEGVAVRVTGVGPVKFGVSTRMTSLSAPAPTEVSLTNEPPLKLSVQL